MNSVNPGGLKNAVEIEDGGAPKQPAYPRLAREVTLWLVSGHDKEHARRGIGNSYRLQSWPAKFWEVELAS